MSFISISFHHTTENFKSISKDKGTKNKCKVISKYSLPPHSGVGQVIKEQY